jgi:hypothetical protein
MLKIRSLHRRNNTWQISYHLQGSIPIFSHGSDKMPRWRDATLEALSHHQPMLLPPQLSLQVTHSMIHYHHPHLPARPSSVSCSWRNSC